MLRECIYGGCAQEQHVRRTLTLTHMITAYSASGNVIRVHILICATRKSRVEKEFTYVNDCVCFNLLSDNESNTIRVIGYFVMLYSCLVLFQR